MTRRAPEDKARTPAGTPAQPPARTRVCARCLRETAEAVLVEWIDTGSGPGLEVWTCPEHVRGYTPGLPRREG
ncbi:hypothetical protein ACWD5R_17960 [Streptomyces sp. NPDC002514]|uniref:hypothetical protein n=1 Tax=Streptomyces sp. NPDC001270 TaxID=3364554 RepID=UPI0036A80D65